MSTDNIIRTVQTALVAVVSAFGISVVVAGHWWTNPPPTVHVAAVADQVTGLIRDQFATKEAFRDLKLSINDGAVTLINTDLNQYKGLAAVTTRRGATQYLEINVWADVTGAMFYEMDAMSASNLIDAAKAENQNCYTSMNETVCPPGG
ncbi:MAG: hypothetical protein HZB45_15680 [Mycolicibacterium rufum]|nr:hypothetical protein [Mycolicibacterium rufum]